MYDSAQDKETGDRMGAGLCAERKALWRDSDTVPVVEKNNKRNLSPLANVPYKT